jgi:hypothetical protein
VTPEQRFRQIDVTMQAIGECQLRTDGAIEDISQAVKGLNQSISRFAESVDARKRFNGKSHN